MNLKAITFLVVGVFAGAAVTMFLSPKHAVHAEDRQIAAQTASSFPGKVDLNFITHAGVTDLVQIVDKDHRIVCYGRMSLGGASTISCQKF
jgi:hypothetical protein